MVFKINLTVTAPPPANQSGVWGYTAIGASTPDMIVGGIDLKHPPMHTTGTVISDEKIVVVLTLEPEDRLEDLQRAHHVAHESRRREQLTARSPSDIRTVSWVPRTQATVPSDPPSRSAGADPLPRRE